MKTPEDYKQEEETIDLDYQYEMFMREINETFSEEELSEMLKNMELS